MGLVGADLQGHELPSLRQGQAVRTDLQNTGQKSKKERERSVELAKGTGSQVEVISTTRHKRHSFLGSVMLSEASRILGSKWYETQPLADPGDMGARPPLPPRFLQNHAVSPQLCLGPWVKTPPAPLTKILDPPLQFAKSAKVTMALISIEAALEQEATVQTFATRWSTEHNRGYHIG